MADVERPARASAPARTRSLFIPCISLLFENLPVSGRAHGADLFPSSKGFVTATAEPFNPPLAAVARILPAPSCSAGVAAVDRRGGTATRQAGRRGRRRNAIPSSR